MNKRAHAHLLAYSVEITILKHRKTNNKLAAPVTVGCVIASVIPAWKAALPTLTVQEHLLASGHRHSELHPEEHFLQSSSAEFFSGPARKEDLPNLETEDTTKIVVYLSLDQARFPKIVEFRGPLLA